jgi:hypothetical protein
LESKLIISFRHKFVFIKTLKTAGSSIEASLNEFLGAEDIATPIFPEVPGHVAQNFVSEAGRVRNHGTALEARDLISSRGCNPDDFHFWSVEREPLDKCLSHYSMMRFSPDHAKFKIRRPQTILMRYPILNWSTYVLMRSFPTDDVRLLDTTGNKAVGTILRYESLSRDLPHFLETLGVRGFQLSATAKSGFRRGPKPKVHEWQVDRIYKSFEVSNSITGYSKSDANLTLDRISSRQ